MKTICKVTIFLFLAISLNTPVFAEMPVIERQALQKLYTDTDPGWPSCGWQGKRIVCNANKTNVTQVYLQYFNVTNILPAEMVDLQELTTLDLSHNSISDFSSLANMAKLKILNLNYNSVTSIPQELLINLEELYLSNNKIPILPEITLPGLSNLTTLNLESTTLGAMPDLFLGSLKNLTKLNIAFNQLTVLPPSLNNISTLYELLVAGNNLTSLDLNKLNRLTTLKAFDNRLDRMPTAIGTLRTLTTINLTGNKIAGEIPASFKGLPNLNLSYNALYARDQGLKDFLNKNQPGWETTQTVAPSNIKITSILSDSVSFSWDIIPYTADAGGYEVCATASPFPLLCKNTLNKSVKKITIDGLNPNVGYSFTLRTFTFPHMFNPKNKVFSESVLINNGVVVTTPSSPAIAVTPTSVDFGTVESQLTNNSYFLTVTVANNSPTDSDLRIEGITGFFDPFFLIDDFCSGQIIPVAGSCIFTVEFSPVVMGDYSNDINVISNATNSPELIIVSGSATSSSVPVMSITDSEGADKDFTINFGGIPASTTPVSYSVFVDNFGSSDLFNVLVDNPGNILPPSPFSILSDTCSGNNIRISPNGQCEIKIQFSPTAAGKFSNNFEISSNDTNNSPVTITLTGEGLINNAKVPQITMTTNLPKNQNTVFLGEVPVGPGVKREVTLINTGNAPLDISSITNTGIIGSPFSIINNVCVSLSPSPILPSASCTFDVQFTPTSGGNVTGNFDIISNAPDSPTVLAVNGTGLAPIIEISIPLNKDNIYQHSFGNIFTGTTDEYPVTITNYGDAALNINQDTSINEQFSFNGTCNGANIEPNNSCTFSITFSPASTASFGNSFNIRSNDPDEPLITVNITGTGVFSNNNGGAASGQNSPPLRPALVFPEDGQDNFGTTVTFIWKKTTDPDGDPLSYKLHYCENFNFLDCSAVTVSSLTKMKISGANILGLTSFFILCLVLNVFLFFTRKGRYCLKVWVILTIVSIGSSGIIFTGCMGGGASDSGSGESSTSPSSPVAPNRQPDSDEMSTTISGLKGDTVYYWKVEINDGNGNGVETEIRNFRTR